MLRGSPALPHLCGPTATFVSTSIGLRQSLELTYDKLMSSDSSVTEVLGVYPHRGWGINTTKGLRDLSSQNHHTLLPRYTHITRNMSTGNVIRGHKVSSRHPRRARHALGEPQNLKLAFRNRLPSLTRILLRLRRTILVRLFRSWKVKARMPTPLAKLA